jgi:hypothetical protein
VSEFSRSSEREERGLQVFHKLPLKTSCGVLLSAVLPVLYHYLLCTVTAAGSSLFGRRIGDRREDQIGGSQHSR